MKIVAGRAFTWKVGLIGVLAAVISASLFGALPRGSAQQNDPSAAIRQVLDKQRDAWNRGDIPAFLEGYWNSPKLTFAGSDGVVRGYGGLLERYQKSYPDAEAMGHLEFSELEIEPLGQDAVMVLGHWHLKRAKGDAGGVFTLIFRKFPTGWRIIHDHTSAQKQTP